MNVWSFGKTFAMNSLPNRQNKLTLFIWFLVTLVPQFLIELWLKLKFDIWKCNCWNVSKFLPVCWVIWFMFQHSTFYGLSQHKITFYGLQRYYFNWVNFDFAVRALYFHKNNKSFELQAIQILVKYSNGTVGMPKWIPSIPTWPVCWNKNELQF